MAFKRLINRKIEKKKDDAGVLIAIEFEGELEDDAHEGIWRIVRYKIEGAELATITGTKAQQRAKIKAIIKREAKKVYQNWINVEMKQPPAPKKQEDITDQFEASYKNLG